MTGRPSYYLQELHSVATKVGIGEQLARHKFHQALSSTVSPFLVAQNELSVTQQLGKLNDKFCTYFREQNQVMHVNSNSSHNNRRNNCRNDWTNYTMLSHVPMELRLFNHKQRPAICQAHLYFAVKARTCMTGCKRPNKTNVKVFPSSRSSSPHPQSNEVNNQGN